MKDTEAPSKLFGCNRRLHETNANVLETSHAVTLAIAKEKKPHAIGETLIKPCAKKMVEIILGKEAKKKIAAISLSNNTVQRGIEDMSTVMKKQVVEEITSAPFGLFSIRLDESTDVGSCSQLMTFVRYIHFGKLKEEFLFCTALKSTTKSIRYNYSNVYFFLRIVTSPG